MKGKKNKREGERFGGTKRNGKHNEEKGGQTREKRRENK